MGFKALASFPVSSHMYHCLQAYQKIPAQSRMDFLLHIFSLPEKLCLSFKVQLKHCLLSAGKDSTHATSSHLHSYACHPVSPVLISWEVFEARNHVLFCPFIFLNFLNLFTYLWLCWVFTVAHMLSPVVASGGYSLLVVHGLLSAMASLDAGHGL